MRISATADGLNLTNYGEASAMAAEGANRVYAHSPDATLNQRYTIAFGVNDQATYTTANQQQVYHDEMESLIAWAALSQSSNKRRATNTSAWAYTGTWTDSTHYSGNGTISRKATANGSTATITVTGPVIYLNVTVEDGNTGTFDVAIDGGAPTSYNVAPVGPITTYIGQTYGPRLIRFGGLANTAHTIVVTATSASAGNPVYVDWIAGVGAAAQPTWPKVFACTITRKSAAGYVASGGSDVRVAAYNGEIAAIVTELSGDGLQVTLADVGAVVDPTTELSDGVHPNTAGQSDMAGVLTPLVN